jgi:putative hemolysin
VPKAKASAHKKIMDSSFGLVIILVLLIGCSAFFSATETAYSSLNRIRIKNLAKEGNKKALLVERLSLDYDKLLSTILIGNNIVNILASSLATVLFVQYFGNAGVTISTIVMTILVLIFGEISPKSLAKEQPEGYAIAVSKIVVVLQFILTPINYLFGLWKKLLGKLFKSKNDSGITEEELLTIVDEAQSGGEIDADESDLIKSAIEFNDLEAGDILTPRIDVCALELNTSTEEIIEMFLESGFSRLPVYRDTIDNIIGVVHQKDLFHLIQKNSGGNIEEIISPVIYVSPSISISELIRVLQNSKSHFAVVIDEYGGTDGILTLEDILEELVGEIWDEHDKVVENISELSDGIYEILGGTDLDDFLKLMDEKPGDDDPNTVSGWVMEKLGKMPELGDTFEYNGHHIYVIEMENRRVAKIKVKILQNK